LYNASFFQNVPPKSGSPSVSTPDNSGAPAQQQQAPGGGMLTMLIPLLLFVPIFFLMFRRQKKEAEARKNLKKGDRVVSTSGLVGELVEVLDAQYVKVKIAPGTTVQMLANSISPVPAPEPEKGSQELKDAKAVSDKK
jgi:preprotein translocase subunit YajC